jgi:hypothetical protein
MRSTNVSASRIARLERRAQEALREGCGCESAATIFIARVGEETPLIYCHRCGSERQRIVLPDNGRGSASGSAGAVEDTVYDIAAQQL